jgi:hypothetical protein
VHTTIATTKYLLNDSKGFDNVTDLTVFQEDMENKSEHQFTNVTTLRGSG